MFQILSANQKAITLSSRRQVNIHCRATLPKGDRNGPQSTPLLSRPYNDTETSPAGFVTFITFITLVTNVSEVKSKIPSVEIVPYPLVKRL